MSVAFGQLPINVLGWPLPHVDLSLLVGKLTNEKMREAGGANGGSAGAGRPHAARGMGRRPSANKLEGRGILVGGRAWRSQSKSP